MPSQMSLILIIMQVFLCQQSIYGQFMDLGQENFEGHGMGMKKSMKTFGPKFGNNSTVLNPDEMIDEVGRPRESPEGIPRRFSDNSNLGSHKSKLIFKPKTSMFKPSNIFALKFEDIERGLKFSDPFHNFNQAQNNLHDITSAFPKKQASSKNKFDKSIKHGSSLEFESSTIDTIEMTELPSSSSKQPSTIPVFSSGTSTTEYLDEPEEQDVFKSGRQRSPKSTKAKLKPNQVSKPRPKKDEPAEMLDKPTFKTMEKGVKTGMTKNKKTKTID